MKTNSVQEYQFERGQKSLVGVKAMWKAFFVTIGLDPLRTIRLLGRLPWYFRDFRRFRRALKASAEWPIGRRPVLTDFSAEAAQLGEYFWQDLFVAKRIIDANPRRHVDVGSRVDGFIGHLACVRSVEVFDIRPLQQSIPNVIFTQCDMSQPNDSLQGISDCLSCLHTIEHVGLGRYSDPIEMDGWKDFLASLSTLLEVDGFMWLSTPIGHQRVEFNAHRVFHPNTIRLAGETLGLKLLELHYLADNQIKVATDLEEAIERLGQSHYTLGIFLFQKLSQ